MIDKLSDNLITTGEFNNNQSIERMDELLNLPNLLLIAGEGRNVGKTFLACSIISFFSKNQEVIGVKISSHFHPIDKKSNIIAKTKNYIVIEETSISGKDSSLMLQAGAKKVFFIMTQREMVKEAFDCILHEISGFPIVCESGGLHNYIIPGKFLFVSKNREGGKKKQILRFKPLIVNNIDNHLDFQVESLLFENNKIEIK